ncbi:Protein NLRC3 [Beauveria bassiana]|uniref:Protein NLRC3 n=1 Tax=Beauveria bassiana TaxID=176275 RepID=A0A2N6ND15_BEABA|nr:Protein NLRC3 [Beauveria bassiana]
MATNTAEQTTGFTRPSLHMSAGWITLLCFLAGTIILLWLRRAPCSKPAASTADDGPDPSPPTHKGVQLVEVTCGRNEANTDIDIIAIHGLDTTSRDTWTWKDPRDPKNNLTWVNWLHPGMLPESVDRVRIFTCDWPADLLVPSDLIQKTIEEYAVLLLEGIENALFAGSARQQDRSIVFIASCLGGLILTRALVRADDKRNRSSATLDIIPDPLPLDRPHSLMNKFRDSQCPDYKKVVGQIREMVGKIRAGTPLEQADSFIREKHYTADRLKIERLSGEPLSMDRCYINLAIIEQVSQNASDSKKKGDTMPSPFSILARQKVEAPDQTMQVELATIFNERKGSDGQPVHPRRILIRGRAGVGKTTLCKKIVHEFTKGTWGKWTELFDRVLWVPLRNLKHEGRRKMPVYAFEDLLSHEFLPTNKRSLAEALSRVLDAKSSKTLFLLDGLDEVSQDLTGDAGMARFLNRLLSQPSVIITARPSAAPPANLDLELETIGFGPDQVNEYIEKSFTNPDTGATDQTKVGKVKSFLQERWLIQGLVRIPIQLDALCYTWDDFQPDEIPNTMTGMYKEIALKLWKKDVERLAKRHNGDLVTASQITSSDAEDLVADEVYFLEGLAFTGLHNDVIDFNAKDRDVVSTEFRRQGMLLDKVLPHLSFVRTSDPSSAAKYRSYHFIHLTFQEYFAARYFVRQWKNQGQLQFLTLSSKGTGTTASAPADFLRKHKYTARYDIFWRFVAGLLDGNGQALEFINTVEEEPLDLLGPTHQRLVMHCLSEISSSLPMREMLEKRLAQWLLLESTFNKTALLASEVEFPELALKTSLLEESTDVQRTILRSLVNRASISPSIIEQVAARLDNADRHVRDAAVEALGGRSELPEAVLTAVAARLDDGDEDVRRAAVEALGGRSELPEAVLTAVAARLDDGDEDVRRAAVEALGGRSELPEAVLTAVAARLDDGDRVVRRAAFEALGGRSELPEAVLKAVAARLDDGDWVVRRAAVQALGGRSELPEAVLTAVAARLDDAGWVVRRAAVQALGRRSELPEAVLKAVAARLDDADGYVRRAAVEALGRRSELPEAVLTAVAARLDDADGYVRRAAVEALGGRSELPEAVLTAVAARLDDADGYVRPAAVEALGRRSELPEAVLTAVAARLDDADGYVRRAAVQALGRRSELPEAVLTAVAARLDDADGHVRRAAIQALGRRSELPEAVLTAVAARLDDGDRHVRRAAIQALGRRSELPEAVLTAVAARLDDGDRHVRRAAVEVIINRNEKLSRILKGSLIASFYKALLERSFKEQLSWYIKEDSYCVNMPGGIVSLSVDIPQNEVREWIKGARLSIYKRWGELFQPLVLLGG